MVPRPAWAFSILLTIAMIALQGAALDHTAPGPLIVPYVAQEHVLQEQPASIRDITFRANVLAWTEVPWDPTHWPKGPGSLRAIDLTDANPSNARVLRAPDSDELASAPAVFRDTVIFRGHVGDRGPPNWVHGRMLSWNLTTGDVTELYGETQRLSEPTFLGTVLSFLTHEIGAPAVIHQIDLVTGQHRATEAPRFEHVPARVWSVSQDLFVIATERPNIIVWNSQTSAYDPLTVDGGLTPTVADGLVAWAEFREGAGPGTSVYVHELATSETTRATVDPSRQYLPTISGQTLAWSHLYSTDRDHIGYEIHFKDLATAHAYRLEGTRQYTAGPALDGDRLAYADDEGRLLLIDLPPTSDRLTAELRADLRTDDHGTWLELELVPNASSRPVELTTWWTTNTSGASKPTDTLHIEINGTSPALDVVEGVAVDPAERHVIVTVDVDQVYRSLLEPATRTGQAGKADIDLKAGAQQDLIAGTQDSDVGAQTPHPAPVAPPSRTPLQPWVIVVGTLGAALAWRRER